MCPVCVPFVSRLPPAVSFYGTGYCTVPERVPGIHTRYHGISESGRLKSTWMRQPRASAARLSQLSADAERSVGICEYVSRSLPGIGGVVKARPSDFQVNEISIAGNEVRNSEAAIDESRADEQSEGTDDALHQFTRFTLRKERMDTFGAIAEMARQLEVPARSFGFAGLKDFRAVTTQEMTVRGVPTAAVRVLVHSHLQISSCRKVARSLRLGQLSGNRFRIVLRSCQGTSAEVEAALSALARRGFVNYFGMQRFGETAARNDEVGKHLLLGQYAAAVDALLKPRPDDTRTGSAEAEAREAWERSNDVRTVLKLMPRVRSVEREVLSALARTLGETQTLSFEERCRLAVLSLPLNLRRLLAHAYFSRLWNLAASERLRRHGLRRALEGELVLPRGKRFARLMRRGSGARRDAVHVVTAEEAAAGVYSVRRVVLPLPGRLIEMPRTAVGRFYSQLLDLDGVETPSLERAAKRARSGAEAQADAAHVGAREEEEEQEGPWESDVADHGTSDMDANNDDAAAEGKDPSDAAWQEQAMDEVQADSDPSSSSSDSWSWFELNGDYRPLLLRPRRMTWQVMDAVSLDEISEFKNLSSVTAGSALGMHDVFLQFDLPPGAYATIALREVQKENPAPTRKTHIRF